MKRFKKIYILLGVLAAACILTFGAMQIKERKEQIKNSEEIILEIPADSVEALSWEYGSETLAFHKDEAWVYDEDETFPVDEEKISGLLDIFQQFGVSFVIEEVEDYGQYGLEEPICTIRLTAGEQSYEILLGDYSSMDSQRYVSIGDGNVYLVKQDPLELYDGTLSELIRHDKIPLFDGADEIRFTGNETYTIAYEENSTDTYCKDDVYFTEQDGQKQPLDTSRVDGYLSDISYLNLTDYVTYHASEEEIKDCGLDAPELSVEVSYTREDEDGQEVSDTFTLHVSRDPDKKASATDGEAENEAENGGDTEEEEVTAYARVGESGILYRISPEDYKRVMDASFDSLRHSKVFTGDFADVTQIDIALEGATYTLTSEKKDEERIFYYQGEQIESLELQRAIEGLNADSFTKEQPAGTEEIGLTLYLDNENFPKIEIELYRYDGKDCLAVVNKEPVSLVERALAVDLMEVVYGFVLE